MTGVDLKLLLDKCNLFCSQALYDAAGLAVDRTHYEVAVEHFLLKCLEAKDGDIPLILKHYGVNHDEIAQELFRCLNTFQGGCSSRPVFSPMLVELLESAWLTASVDLQQRQLRSGAALLAFLRRPGLYSQSFNPQIIKAVNRDEALRSFQGLVMASQENPVSLAEEEPASDETVAAGESFVAKFCEDYTAKARAGKLDPVFGRDAEIRSIMTILGRRRKNNPILVGEPGVGKTAVIEGLALRIVEGDVPQSLTGVTLLGLDMGLLEAGASMKGEFERRLKGVIDEIKASLKPVILFIDEAHMLVGAGGQAGGSDAANLLKPALARGELKTCAATTWKEYKKYFEKDPALARRFQLVTLDEPDVPTTSLILRGLRKNYEAGHQVIIRDDAIDAAAEYAHRYITGRFLPDKAVDLIDTACSTVKLSLFAKPGALENKERSIQAKQRQLDGLERDANHGTLGYADTIASLQNEIRNLEEEARCIEEQWKTEQKAAHGLIEARNAYAEALQRGKTAGASFSDTNELTENDGTQETIPVGDSVPATEREADSVSEEPSLDNAADSSVENQVPDLQDMAQRLEESRNAYETAVQGNPMVHVEVSPDIVAQAVADWTGIPVGKVARDQASLIATLENHLKQRIIGQDSAIQAISQGIKGSKAGLRDPLQPLGTFLLVGPSGVGKTESGLALADILFGNEESVISINMSEFQERHTTSRLIGSPPGYVGYGEGGLLTEAVRQRPYSVILLDEVEKAHPDVLNLFYQVFDKGTLTDGEGKKISFSNTIIMLTSNLGSEAILDMTADRGVVAMDKVSETIRPILTKHFKAALLARMTVVPFVALNPDALARIARLKLEALKKRLVNNNGIAMEYSDKLVEEIIKRCGEVDTGARNIDAILSAHLLPRVGQFILEKMSADTAMPSRLFLDVTEDSEFSIEFGE